MRYQPVALLSGFLVLASGCLHIGAPPLDPECQVPIIDIDVAVEGYFGILGSLGDLEIEDAVVDVAGTVFPGAVVEVHGGSSRRYEKKNYRFKLPELENGEDPQLDLFGDGLEEIRRIVLHAAWIDQSFIRNKLTLDLVREMGGYAPRVQFAIVTVNGQPHGLYTMIERVDKIYLKKNGMDNDGNLYKAEEHSADWEYDDNPLDGYRKVNQENVSSMDLSNLLRALTHTEATYEQFQEHVEPRLNLEDHRIFSQAHVFALNRDTFNKNYYLYHDPSEDYGTEDGRFRVISWDADSTFGITWNGKEVPVSQGNDKWRAKDPFSSRIYDIPEYRQWYLNRYKNELENGALRPERIERQVEKLRGQIGACASWDMEVWGREGDFDQQLDDIVDFTNTRHRDLLSRVNELLSQ